MRLIPQAHRHSRRHTLVLVVLAAVAGPAALSQTAYRHRDANGQWVFTDQAATSTASGDSFNLAGKPEGLTINVERRNLGDHTELVASNDCLCAVTIELEILDSTVAEIPANSRRVTQLAPRTRQTLLRTNQTGAVFHYRWRAALGSPDAQHAPARAYRAPFAIGAAFPISQAYPAQMTHVTPDSQYAVDIVLPDGTPVYCAREGTVINVRHDSFRGFAAPVMFDQANVIEILHDDGTIAIYAHLHWDSIRVRIGARVVRGQYIADSGNTGFSSGPHLHFAVVRNSGAEDISVPVQFAGPAGTTVEPATGSRLTAY